VCAYFVTREDPTIVNSNTFRKMGGDKVVSPEIHEAVYVLRLCKAVYILKGIKAP
jgi:hypothetical protein